MAVGTVGLPAAKSAIRPESGGVRASVGNAYDRRPNHRWSIAFSVLAMLIGLMGLIGYGLGNSPIGAIFPGTNPMSASVALALVILGAAVLGQRFETRRSNLASMSLGIVAVVAFGGELVIGLTPRGKAWEASGLRDGIPLHPSVLASVLMILLALGLLSISRRRDLSTHWIGTAAVVLCAAVFFGYIFEVPTLLDPSQRVAPAIAGTIGMLSLALAELWAEPRGWMVVLSSRSTSGTMARLLLPAAVIFPLLGSALFKFIEHDSWYTPQLGLSLLVVSDVIFSAVLILGAAALLQARETHARVLEEERYASSLYARSLIEASLDPLVTISAEGQITDVNAATEAATGRRRSELIGTDFCDYFTQPEYARAGYRKVLDEGQVRDYALTIRHVSGRTTDVLYNASLYRDANGSVKGVFAAARDVTRTKRAEEERRAAALYARSLIEASLDPLVTISAAGKITDVNAATEAVTGHDRQALIGCDFSDFFTEPETARAGYRKVLDEGQVRDYPLTIRHVSGLTTDVLYNASLYRDASGAVAGVFAAARDVTERKRIEARNEMFTRLLRAISEANQVLIREHDRARLLRTFCEVITEHGGLRLAWIGRVDPTTRIVEPVAVAGHDQGYVSELNIPLDDSPRGRGPTATAIKEDRTVVLGDARTDPRFEPWRAAAMLRGYRSSATLPLRLHDRVWGALVVYAAEPDAFAAERLALLEELASNLVRTLSAFEAEQARQEAEERLRIAGAYNRTLIETSLDPLVTISAEGKITDVNAATEAVTGRDRHELIGRDFSEYFTEPDKAREGYRKVLDEGEVRDYPLTIRHTSGRTTDVLYNATLYRNEAGNVQGVFAAARDITERKLAEERLHRTLADLARSNKELEQFAYVASHDLQEPLRMVSSYTQLLAQRYRDKLDADANDFIDFAVDGARRMQRLINDLLAYSRVGTRGKPLQPTGSDGAFRIALSNLQALIAETGGVVTNDVLPLVLADDGQLVQLFQNLIGNAIKFHRAEVPPRVHVSATPMDGMWRFSVTDNGIGIAPEFHSRLFIIFQRLHSREEYPGTGIGLALCKRIVERHGGRIWLESASGKGSTFHFTLRAAEERGTA